MTVRKTAQIGEVLWDGLLPGIVFLLPWGARLLFAQPVVAGQTVEGLTLAVSALEVLVWVAAGLFVIWYVQSGYRFRVPAGRVLWPLLLGAAWCLASVAWAADTAIALQQFGHVATAGALFFLLSRAPNPSWLRSVFVWSACLQVGLGVVQYLTQNVPPSTLLGVASHVPWDGPASVVEYAGGRLLRIYGTFPHPNILGGYLALALLVSLAQAEESRWNRWYTFAAAFCTFALLLTFSRSAWIAAAVGVVILILGILMSPRLLQVMVPRVAVCLFVVVIVVVGLAPFFAGRLTATGRLESRSISERTASLLQGKSLWLNHPIQGVGIGNATAALARQNATTLEPPHALPLIILVELGLVGFAVAVVLASAVLRRMERSPRAIALVAALAVLALFDHYLWTTVPGLFFGVSALALALPPPEP